MTFDFAAAFAAGAEKSGRNMHNATSASLPEAGTAYGRLVGVVEIGKQQTTYKNQPVVKDQIALVFELSGPKWRPDQDGRLPLRMTKFTNSDSANSRLHKLMNKIDPAKKYRHIGQALGQVFFVEIEHNKRGDQTYADIGEIALPIRQDMDTGEMVDMASRCAPQVAKMMGFMWDSSGLDHWDNLFIEGSYDDGGSRNRYQSLIRGSVEFEESPIFGVLDEAGRDPWADYQGGVEIPESGDKNYKAATDRIERIKSGRGRPEEGDGNTTDEGNTRTPRNARAPRTPR